MFSKLAVNRAWSRTHSPTHLNKFTSSHSQNWIFSLSFHFSESFLSLLGVSVIFFLLCFLSFLSQSPSINFTCRSDFLFIVQDRKITLSLKWQVWDWFTHLMMTYVVHTHTHTHKTSGLLLWLFFMKTFILEGQEQREEQTVYEEV